MSMSLCMYTPLDYVLANRKAYYENLYETQLEGKARFKQIDREFSLKALMKTNLLKRLVSSIYAFDKTITYLTEGAQAILDAIKSNDSSEITDLDANSYFDDDDSQVEGLVSIQRLSHILHYTVPSPTILIFELKGKYLFASAMKRINQNEKERIVVEEYYYSDGLTYPHQVRHNAHSLLR